MQKFALIIAFTLLLAAASPARAGENPLDDLAFMTGAWRGGEEFIFEETWKAPAARIMTGMARGRQAGALRVLEYIVVSEEADGVIMRFNHFNADYSTWEKDGAVVMLALTSARENDVTFSADPPSETVKSIRYWMPAEYMLQADVVLVEDGVEDGFSLVFTKAD